MGHIHKSCISITSGFISPSASEALSLQLTCINANEALEKELALSCQKKDAKQTTKPLQKYKYM